MKRFPVLQYTVIAMILLSALSCHKRGDFEVNCRILKIAYHDPNGHPGDITAHYEGVFQYNSWGDPVKLTWSATTTGRTNFTFKYDNKRRLKEFIGRYEGSTGFDHYTKYFYAPNGALLFDTTWYGGTNINDVWEGSDVYGYIVNTYTFDSKGRVTQIHAKHSFGLPVTYNYEYDANGNLIRPPFVGAVYDNKKHYLRTNLVLMFIQKDYSVNNYRIAEAYNNKGLPLSWETPVTFWNGPINEVEYNCGHSH